MKSQKLIQYLLTALLLCGIQSYSIGQTLFTERQDTSTSKLTKIPLYKVARILPQAVSDHYQKVSLKKELDLAKINLGKSDLKEMKYLSQIKILKQVNEEQKPSLFQQPYMIVGYVVLAFATGIFLGLGG